MVGAALGKLAWTIALAPASHGPVQWDEGRTWIVPLASLGLVALSVLVLRRALRTPLDEDPRRRLLACAVSATPVFVVFLAVTVGADAIDSFARSLGDGSLSAVPFVLALVVAWPIAVPRPWVAPATLLVAAALAGVYEVLAMLGVTPRGGEDRFFGSFMLVPMALAIVAAGGAALRTLARLLRGRWRPAAAPADGDGT